MKTSNEKENKLLDTGSTENSLFRAVFDNNHTMMLLVDPGPKQSIIDVNTAAQKFYGYSYEQFLELNMGDINTKTNEERKKLMSYAMSKPQSHFNFVHITSTGLFKNVDVDASPIVYKNKKIMFIIVHDISELTKSNEQLELAMAGSNLGLWDFWVQTGALHINNRWADMLGYSVEELSPITFNTWKELTHSEDYQKAVQLIERCYIKELNEYKCSIRMKHKNGSWVWIQDRGKVFEWSEDGKALRMSGTHLDITERKNIEIKLAESEKRYRSFFENSPLSLWEQDFSNVMSYIKKLPISGIGELRSYFTKHPEVVKKCIDMVKILDVNSATLEMYEAQSKEDLFWNLGNIFTEEAYENFKEELLCIYNKDQVFSAETNGKTLKGKIIRSRIDLVMLSDYKVLVTITDITEQKLLEKNLTESEAKFRSYFESSPLSLWEEDYSDVIEYLHNLPVSDVSELKVYLEKHSKDVKKCLSLIKILNANKATLDLYDLESKPGNLFEYTRKSSQSGFDTFIEELISLYIKKPLITLYFQDETRKGNIIDVKLEMRLLSDYKYLVTIVDLTEIKKNELFLSKILAQTKADSETKEILLREINHRVKNHLSSFIGMLYAEKKQSGTDSNTVQMEHVDNLINRVKGISLAHELLSKSQWAPISINKLTEKIIHSLQHLIPKDRIVDVKLKPSDIFLDADQSHNTAILINELFTNTIEHASHPGENLVVEIEINKTKESITLLYRDNGPGYPDEILNSEFYNVGMYLIKNIVEQSLRGVFKISNDNGAKIEIEFPGGSKLEEL